MQSVVCYWTVRVVEIPELSINRFARQGIELLEHFLWCYPSSSLLSDQTVVFNDFVCPLSCKTPEIGLLVSNSDYVHEPKRIFFEAICIPDLPV